MSAVEQLATKTGPEELRIRLLGSLAVEGLVPDVLGGRKARTLLKAMALGRGRSVPVDALVDACWGDDLPARPSDQLAVLASRLRRAVGRHRIVHRDGGYTLLVDWLDLDELEGLATEAALRLRAGNHAGARAAATAGLSLVRGPLLADEPEADWAEVDRTAAQRTVARLRHIASDAALAAGDFADAAELAERALDHDTYDEAALRTLMVAWSVAGRPASALAAYARIRARLGEDLGVDPMPETEALHTSILRGEALPGAPMAAIGVAAVVVAAVVVAPPLPGRDEDLRALETTLANLEVGRPVLVEVKGEAGIGKTALLGLFAARAAASGAVVLRGTCAKVEQALPLQAVLDALAGWLRSVGPEEASAVVGEEAGLLGPLLGTGPAATPHSQSLLTGFAGPSLLYGALLTVIERASRGAPLVLLLDDGHLAGEATVEWLQFVGQRARHAAVLMVVARRAGEGLPIAGDSEITLGPLDLAAARAIVGDDRAAELHERSGGNALFLVELAAATGEELPSSLVEAVWARCEQSGAAGDTLRTAALLGDEIDLDLLASVTRQPPVALLEHLEEGVRRRLLEERGSSFAFRHDLVRAALTASATAGRAALVHREAVRALLAAGHPDSLAVAQHAQLAGDNATAAEALVDAAGRAAERFDYRAAEDLLDRSLALGESTAARLSRARVRLLGTRYAEARADAAEAVTAGAGGPALETAGWAAYYARDFESARRAADDGARLATDAMTRASCLTLGGRTRHAAGDLAGSEDQLVQAVGLASGLDLAMASAYLGILRSHQSRPQEALELMRAATLLGGAPGRVATVFHAHLFTGHAEAMSGRPVAALVAFDAYADEVNRRHVERFADLRHENFRAWVLRALGATSEADEHNQIALEAGARVKFAETEAAALVDLAESALLRSDLDGAGRLLDSAEQVLLATDVVFGWRQRMKVCLTRARLALASDALDEAAGLARGLAVEADALGVPRYAVPARILAARAEHRRREPVDLDALAQDVTSLPRVVALDAWWIAAEAAHDHSVETWWRFAEEQAEAIGRNAGAHASRFREHARMRLDELRP